MKYICSIFLALVLLTAPALAADVQDPTAVEPAEVVVTAAPDTGDYTDFQVEVLTVLGAIEGLLVFFTLVILFWAVFKFFRLFF